jgi:hypothetical protein
MPDIRLRRQVRLVYRSVTKRSHASAAFLSIVEGQRAESRKAEDRKPEGQADQSPT